MFRHYLLVIIGLVAAGCSDSPTSYISETPGDTYLLEALDILQANSLHRYEVDWDKLRAAVLDAAQHPQTPRDAYPAIEHALALIGEEHSRLIRPSERQAGEEVTDEPPLIRLEREVLGSDARIGVVRVPQAVGKEIDQLATLYHRGIQRLDTLGPCGWVVDLRGNLGGSMWPMIAGLGPILGEGALGYFVDPDSVIGTWIYEEGVAHLDGTTYVQVDNPYELRDPDAPTVVLVDGRTASSAEATFIAFRGRPNTHSIGTETYGFSTYNRAFHLSDGAILLVTAARMADRTGHVYGGRIWPDDLRSGDRSLEPASDYPFRDALEWLKNQDACSIIEVGVS